MFVYVITGVSTGIGFALLKSISEDPQNLVVGLVRNKAAAEQKVATELGKRSNVHIIHGDLTNYASLKQAAAETAENVGERGIDYLVGNAGLPAQFDAYSPIGELGEEPEKLDEFADKLFKTNVIGNIHLFNLFMPLVLKGKAKKVIAITSGHADLEFINNFDVENSALYSASKAALNIIVAKFSAQYKKDGVLVFSMSPGVVEVGNFGDLTPKQTEGWMKFVGKTQAYAPHFKGPVPVEEAIKTIRSLWERASIESGYAGAFVSHFGNRQWV
ncbi:hypothetical protein GJ744_001064 [Endocarpon pusillum]|uniref:Short chain dehydrogenase n=1 Tax=Endocarpon pusillum TaxID=364733 RepID=A0A8H7ACN9_9EURO|nr:hypothetical protein GJ744_001064 [Endocarpon pusillum]